MVTVTISSKYQIVLPKAIRSEMDLRVGQQIQLIPYQDRIVVVPLRGMKSMRGFLKGIDSTIDREEDRI